MNRHKSCFGFVVLVISIFALFLYLEIETFEPHPSILFRIAGALADASIVAFILLFLRGRWRYVAGVMSVVVGVLIFANVLYFRNFNDLIPASLYWHNQVQDSLVVNSAMQSLQFSDMIVAVFSLLPLIWVSFDNEWFANKNDRKRFLCILLCVMVVGWSVTIFGSIRRGLIGDSSRQNDICEMLFPDADTDWISYYNSMNFTGYVSRVISLSNVERKTISDEEMDQIRCYFKQKSATHFARRDSAISRNLVFIVVESFPSVVLESDFVDAVAPVMSELTKDTATIYVRRCKVLAGLGRSSDAQFIYNTGLLPLKDDILVTNYASNDYPSIAKALKLQSMEIIGEDKRMWSHVQTSRSFGFSRLVDNAGVKVKTRQFDLDSLIFDTAAKEIAKHENPFFMFISTISMHDPYTSAAVTHRLLSENIDCYDARDREYLQRLHHFDEALGRFIKALKRQGVYDKTMIVITGDHEIRSSTVSEALHDDAVPLIMLNSQVKSEYATDATQVDVFPSILDIMGVRYRYLDVDYTGLGKSIFLQYRNSGSLSRDYEISEMLIKSNR